MIKMQRKLLAIIVPGVVLAGATIAVFLVTDNSSKESTMANPEGNRQGRRPNRLIHEKSPYLLQHAYNPVDWYPWGEEAFERARRENKPIFLSIGYSTCHWCHVMEREVFENEEIAALMNKWFVNIKVDREERPDIDQVYMAALQAMTGSGGWPMSLFLTPDLKPFYGGTYFPPTARYGRPGFPEVLRRVREVWETQHDKVLESADELVSFLDQRATEGAEQGALSDSVLALAYQRFVSAFDPSWGGFGGAPKFPRPVTFNFLLRYHRGDDKALEMTELTLRKMAQGGMYDHIGGGFHRYSVDGQWRVPHFEKMLYDQAQLVVSYLETYQLTGDPFFARIARETLDYVLRDMTGPRGAFFSAEDADSPDPDNPKEQTEGGFYLWRKSEIMELLGSDAGAVFCYRYGVRDGGNALSDPQGEFTGRNILYAAHTITETASQFGKSAQEIEKILAQGKEKLFEVRSRRPRPPRDDKVLTSWNGLMISALAKAYKVLGEERYLQAAERAARFLTEQLVEPKTGRLLRRYRDGEARFPGHLDDYAFTVQGLLDLYEASLSVHWLEKAIAFTEQQVDLFWDSNGGGFFDSSGEDPSVLVRMKNEYDGAEPAGNSIAALNLLRLARMVDREEWYEKAEQGISAFAGRIADNPTAAPQMLVAYDFLRSAAVQVIIAGDPADKETHVMLHEVYRRFLPRQVLLFADGGDEQERLGRYLPFIKTISMMDGRPTAYVCQNYACDLPTTDLEVLGRLLDKKMAVKPAAVQSL